MKHTKHLYMNLSRRQPRYLGPEGEPPTGTPPPPKPPEPAKLTQAEVDAIVSQRLAAERAKHLKEQQAHLERIKVLEPEVEKRAELERQIEEINKQTMTKEELARREVEKARKDMEEKVKKSEETSKKWRETYQEEKVVRDIMEAAGHKDVDAFNPAQMVKLIKGDARLVEQLVEGKPTGKFETRITYTSTKDGQVKELDLTPVEALKLMKKEDPNSENLFKSGVTGGLGGSGTRAPNNKLSKLGISQADFNKGYIKGTLPAD